MSDRQDGDALETQEWLDALAALDTGDAVMQAAIARARKVMDKPIPLLLQGESGVGNQGVGELGG